MGVPFEQRSQPRTGFAEPTRPNFYAVPPPPEGSGAMQRFTPRSEPANPAPSSRSLSPSAARIPVPPAPARRALEIPRWIPRSFKRAGNELLNDLLFPDPLNNQEDVVVNNSNDELSKFGEPNFKPDGSVEFNFPPKFQLEGEACEVRISYNLHDGYNPFFRVEYKGDKFVTRWHVMGLPLLSIKLGQVTFITDIKGENRKSGHQSFAVFGTPNNRSYINGDGILATPIPEHGVAGGRMSFDNVFYSPCYNFKIQIRPIRGGTIREVDVRNPVVVLPPNDKFEPKEDDMPCDKCKFSAATVRRVLEQTLTQEVDLKVYDEKEDKIKDKKMKIFGVKPAIDSIKLLYSEFAELRKKKFSIGIPEWWAVRIGADRPQMVIQWADKDENGKIGRSRWSVSIPHYNKKKEDPINLPDYEKGSYMATLILKDNSKLVINAKDKAECDKMIDAIKPMIDPKQIPDPYVVQYGERKGQSLSTKKVTATIGQFYSKGQKDTAADYEIVCNKSNPTPPTGSGNGGGAGSSGNNDNGQNTAGGVSSGGTTSTPGGAGSIDSGGTTSTPGGAGTVTGGVVSPNP